MAQSAGYSQIEALREMVTCAICHEQYQDPRCLPCLHTYCKGCIEKIFEAKKIDCPECRKKYQISNIDKLQVNFQMNNLMSVLQQGEVTTTTKKSPLCEKHEEKLKLFCETCEELICCECTIVDHTSHQFGYLEKIVQKDQELLKEEIKKANTKEEKVDTILEEVQSIEKIAKKNTEQTVQRIDDFINQQVQALQEKRVSLKQKVTEITTPGNQNLAKQRDDIVLYLSDLKAAIENAEGAVITREDNSKIIPMVKEAMRQLSTLTAKLVNETITCDVSTQMERVRSELSKNGIKGFEKKAECVGVNLERVNMESGSIKDTTRKDWVEFANHENKKVDM